MNIRFSIIFFAFLVVELVSLTSVNADYHFSNFRARPPIHVYGGGHKTPVGITPDEIKAVYHLPLDGGKGTIAIISAYDDVSIEKDLEYFSKQFNLPACSAKNNCFEKHLIKSGTKSDSGWAFETTLDVEWAHAIAPRAKILLVEAETPSGQNLLRAIDYAAARSDVVAISMSWGGAEFPEEISLDNHFVSKPPYLGCEGSFASSGVELSGCGGKSGAVFFASSGDNGFGASWPASSPNVIGVGGTNVTLKNDGSFLRETAWFGSGGGVSVYEKQPIYQSTYSISKSRGMRAIPDVAYNADPRTGFPIMRLGIWRTVGGTSAGSPQWAAIAALGKGVKLDHLYTVKASDNAAHYFRDIVSGSNGDCIYYCDARRHYDYITGLGSPLTINF